MNGKDESSQVRQAIATFWWNVVGVAGFEPAASCSQGTRANQAALHPAVKSL
ncbi:MAG: hypothetical protein QG577_2736 [Thermodesulfobacteriota bacterium]|nr:hypothetical protein [Thermodesulfobacteriota bacterium]